MVSKQAASAYQAPPPAAAASEATRWLDEEEAYLRSLSTLCQELSGLYKASFDAYKIVQARFRIPSIVISSVTGLTSFGSSNFPDSYREWVSIAVGIASLSIAIMNSIESYMKIGEHLAGASQASVELHKLKEFIDMELALPSDKRLTQGIIFLRDCYTRYERILEIAPDLIRIVRFIRPSYVDAPTPTPPLGRFAIAAAPSLCAPPFHRPPPATADATDVAVVVIPQASSPVSATPGARGSPSAGTSWVATACRLTGAWLAKRRGLEL